jgi:hypothetical protein
MGMDWNIIPVIAPVLTVIASVLGGYYLIHRDIKSDMKQSQAQHREDMIRMDEKWDKVLLRMDEKWDAALIRMDEKLIRMDEKWERLFDRLLVQDKKG